MTLEQLRKIALKDSIDIQWESLQDKNSQTEFVEVMQKVDSFINELEFLYTQIQKGESVLVPGEASSLSWVDKEELTEKLREELVAGYQMIDVYNRYVSIQTITQEFNDV